MSQSQEGWFNLNHLEEGYSIEQILEIYSMYIEIKNLITNDSSMNVDSRFNEFLQKFNQMKLPSE
tara:strand:+ start:246 stop:440 length:195 start_codon:yes stop_codon:yes gene_type:complete